MKTAIVGSRDFRDYGFFREKVEGHVITEVLSGVAAGADSLAMRWAREMGLPFTGHPAKWKLYGRKAGPVRNALIVRDAEVMIAFWDGASKGTLNAIKQAEARGLKVYIYWPGRNTLEV
jgi:hypothetical protein